ncbi:hypothetical protein MB46_03440 [Arthrobacter alpinus]|uniref:hypothetical protein n=1 Tax=Arthrobacter alpinus TaxID=656366 RepID=UPI0005CA3E22|nr:hypothetical protein [Arthrobacter alpinus]ALV44705.1 hypothetical protein MB46_03440 [Arthrobacter alpinus]
MTTDDDIVRALEGAPSRVKTAQNNRIVEMLTGTPVERTPARGEMRVQERGDGFEATKTWAAKGKADAAVKALAEALMRADKTKGIYAAENEARAMADEAYEYAARRSPFEDVRQEAVASMATVKANSLSVHHVRESNQTAIRRIVTESTAIAAMPANGRMSLRIINEGVGSSGTYPAAVLQQAAQDKIFHKGLHLYVNHPSQTEDYDRPERSVKDLAGVLETDAVFRNGALYAEATVFPQWKDQLAAMADHIGVSIRATADKVGDTITQFYRAESVDFVTRAGRGGAIMSINEHKL